MTHNPQPDLTPPQKAKPQDHERRGLPADSNTEKEDPNRGMDGEDYNYGGASSASNDAKAANPDEKIGAPVEKSGPTPRAQAPAGNHSATEANWGNRSGTGMGGGMAAVEDTGKKAKDPKDEK